MGWVATRRMVAVAVVQTVVLGLLAPAAWAGTGAVATAAGAGPAVGVSAVGRMDLTVRETAGVARTYEVVRQGVPLPKSLGVTRTSDLVVVNGSRTVVPAEFVVLSRWNAGKDVLTAPIQWMLVAFSASVAANASARYQVVFDRSAGVNRPPNPAITVTRSGTAFTVNTGAARFTFGGTQSLLDTATNGAGASVVRGGTMTTTTTTTNMPLAVRSVEVEHQGPLYTSIIVTGAYQMAPLGGGGLSSTRRYVFTAGSPTMEVRHVVAWEGSLCPDSGMSCDAATPNGLQIRRVRDTLDLTASAPFTVTAVGPRNAPAVTRSLPASHSAQIRQLQRSARTAGSSFQVNVDGTVASGSKADGAMLVAGSAAGAVAVATSQMYRNEPQALRLLPTGDLAVDVADGPVWLSARQGLYATIAVAALRAAPTRADLDRLVWAPLNRPLHAWPSAQWFAQSRVVGELPVGPLPSAWADYGTLTDRVIATTYTDIDQKGLAGLTTFGLYPRYWGTDLYGDELDCADGDDPTPTAAADNTYWCASWTDYHNVAAVPVVRAMQTGAVEWLDDLATPAALRMLHTQIQQCSPSDTWFYCGQAPAGYGGYRADFNSSHAYFENLFLYYWLTGDATVVDTVRRGASTMREYLCSRRPATSCGPNDVPTDEWAELSGRVASQWLSAFRFVGQASSDASYLDDWRSGLARAVTQHYIEARSGGVAYGFWTDAQQPVTVAGTYSTDQTWLASLYDMENLRRLQIDTDDAPIGNPPVRPSRVLAAWARTLVQYASRVAGNGTASGQWANVLDVRFSGSRVGGTLNSVTLNTSVGDDMYLWDTGKATLAAVILRAATATGDPALTSIGRALTRLTIDAAKTDGGPLSKVQGEYLAHLPAAVAIVSQAP